MNILSVCVVHGGSIVDGSACVLCAYRRFELQQEGSAERHMRWSRMQLGFVILADLFSGQSALRVSTPRNLEKKISQVADKM